MSKILRRIVFVSSLLLAIIIVICFLNPFYHSQGQNYIRMKGFEKEEKDSVDVVFLGSSDNYTAFSPGLLYEETQVTSFPYGVQAERICLWRTTLKNVLKTQKPKLLVIDVHGAVGNSLEEIPEGKKESAIRFVFDSMPKTPSIFPELDYIKNSTEYDKLSYLFPFIYYHGTALNYSKISKENKMLDAISFLPLKGNRTETTIYRPKHPVYDFSYQESVPVGPDYESYLIDFLEFCKEQDIENILFINVPNVIESEDKVVGSQMADYVGSVVRKYGYDFINFQKCVDEIGIDYDRDFYNAGHLNIYGQAKMTQHLAGIIQEQYHLQPTLLSVNAKSNWDYCKKAYHLYYEYADQMIKQHKKKYVYDSPAFIDYLKRHLGEDVLTK